MLALALYSTEKKKKRACRHARACGIQLAAKSDNSRDHDDVDDDDGQLPV